jgi:Na+/melibiose symporter-like transporter
MTEHAERVRSGDIDQINATDEFARQEAEVGRKVLQNLSTVDQTPLTFRNVLTATNTYTTLSCIALILTYTAALMEFSIPTSQIPFIIQDLGRPELASWLSTASTCATSAILPSMSSFTDVFGRRYALLFGTLLGLAGALVAGFAPSIEIVILGQVRGLYYKSRSVCVKVLMKRVLGSVRCRCWFHLYFRGLLGRNCACFHSSFLGIDSARHG